MRIKKTRNKGFSTLEIIIIAVVLLLAYFLLTRYYSQALGQEKTIVVSTLCRLEYTQEHNAKNSDCPCEGKTCETKEEVEECNKIVADWCAQQAKKPKTKTS